MLVPPGLSYLPYQVDGAHYMHSRSSTLLADEMGLGKTVQVCGLINLDPTLQRVLVICPASLKTNWVRELEKWCPLGIYGQAIGNHFPGSPRVVINYDILGRHRDVLRQHEWDLIVLDEAHYLMSATSQRRQEVTGTPTITPIPARKKVALDGTPMISRPVELYPVLRYLDPWSWPCYKQFGDRYCGGGGKVLIQHFGGPENWSRWNTWCGFKGLPTGPSPSPQQWDDFAAHNATWGMKVKRLDDYTGASNLDELHDKLHSGIMLRRTKAGVLPDLPKKFRQVVELDGGAKIARLIDLEHTLWAQATGTKGYSEQGFKAAVLQLDEGGDRDERWEQLSTVRRELAEAKLPYVVDYLRDAIASHGKVVCFVHHRDSVAALQQAFPQSVSVVGGLDGQVKQSAVDRFQGDPRVQLFIGTKAAAEGITLTASSHVVIAEMFWVPGIVTQMEDRCHRIGQTDCVTAQHLVMAGSLDVGMAKACVRKQIQIDKVMAA